MRYAQLAVNQRFIHSVSGEDGMIVISFRAPDYNELLRVLTVTECELDALRALVVMRQAHVVEDDDDPALD